MKEDRRRRFITVLAWGSWITAIALTSLLTYFNITHPLPKTPNPFQRIGGLLIILSMGVGIAAGTALSRIKLGETITRVFDAGVEYGKHIRKNK